MKLFHYRQRGQAIVEYALLLMIAALSATAFLSLDESLKLRVAEIATEFQSDVALVDQPPIEIIEKCDPEKGVNCLELSPPVAKFKTPNPNYKGRDIRIVNESYDNDGYVEHYIWSINGKIVKETAEEVNADGGIVVNFRNPGTYPVSLIVIDNDGLVSSLYSDTIQVINRPPTVDVSVKNEQGESGNSVSVYQGCSATFYTLYEDEDLPYDVLSLRSVFRDHSGVTSTDTTVPHEFKREFQNLGTNTYTVTVTDENGASATESVSVNVIANPYGAGICGPQANVTKPQFEYTVYVDGQQISPETGTNIYPIPVGKSANVVPVVKWGTYPAHNIPIYWKYTGNTGNWSTTTSRILPSPNVFKVGDKDIPVEGMARDRSATSSVPNPSLGGMSNADNIILRPFGGALGSRPVAKITFKATAKVFNGNKDSTSTTPTAADLTSVDQSRVIMSVSSVSSVASPGDVIKGVRWTLPDGSTRPRAGENGAISIVDSTGATGWWYQGKLNSSDTVQGDRTFNFVKNGTNTYNYKLEVISDKGVRSSVVSKTLKLDVVPNVKPNAVCSPSDVIAIKKGEGIGGKFNASLSKDPDNSSSQLRAQWGQTSSAANTATSVTLTTGVPNWKYGTAGTYKVYLKVTDPKGASDTTSCTVRVVDPNKADPYEFYVEFWYFNNGGSKARIARSNYGITVSNRTTDYFPSTNTHGDIRHVHETIFKARADTGEWTGPLYVNKNIYGIDTRLGGDTDHYEDLYIDTKKKQATIVVTLYVTDADGKVSSCYNYGSSPTTELNNGKSYCKKPTRFFRTAAETRPLPNGQRCTYYTVKRELTTINQYMDRWKTSLDDNFEGFSLEQKIKNELKCQ